MSEKTPLLTDVSKQTSVSKKPSEAEGLGLGSALVAVGCVAFGVVAGLHGRGVYNAEHASSSMILGTSDAPAPDVHIATVNFKTTMDDKHDKYESYDTQPHPFHHCLSKSNNTPTDPEFAKWTSDGQAQNKLDQVKKAVLLDPIGKLRENGNDVKVYDARFQIDMVDHDGHAPIQADIKNFTETKKLAEGMCQNPIGAVVTGGYLDVVSADCEERLLRESNDVYKEFTLCEQRVESSLSKIVSMEEWAGKNYSLKTDGEELQRMYDKRQKSGKAYDDFFDAWLTAHNDALAACTYAANQISFVSELEDKYLSKLDEEKAQISKHCQAIPTFQPFDISVANVAPNLGADSDEDVPKIDESNACYPAIEAINGLRLQTASRETTRSQCLEFYCEKIQKTTLPAARTNAETAKITYDNDDENFNAAYLRYTKSHQDYVKYKAAVKLNLDFSHEAFDLANTSMTQVTKLREDLIETASCPPSTICCVPPVTIPEICHRHARGEVATFVEDRDNNNDVNSVTPSDLAKPFTPSNHKRKGHEQ